ncbi:hypothetical protein [Pararhizobium qamdonense]|uniref:hypothetical protein n=1 Tax=Pararhizobium qamdonense TaxID=3031126 RepID=UPI0023E10D4E|nr:hypothetical protein [Pararhizobium qamdonense]
MDQHSLIDTIHERRAGIDMIAMPYKRDTFYAKPAKKEGKEADNSSGDCKIPSLG